MAKAALHPKLEMLQVLHCSQPGFEMEKGDQHGKGSVEEKGMESFRDAFPGSGRRKSSGSG